MGLVNECKLKLNALYSISLKQILFKAPDPDQLIFTAKFVLINLLKGFAVRKVTDASQIKPPPLLWMGHLENYTPGSPSQWPRRGFPFRKL